MNVESGTLFVERALLEVMVLSETRSRTTIQGGLLIALSMRHASGRLCHTVPPMPYSLRLSDSYSCNSDILLANCMRTVPTHMEATALHSSRTHPRARSYPFCISGFRPHTMFRNSLSQAGASQAPPANPRGKPVQQATRAKTCTRMAAAVPLPWVGDRLY